MNVRDALEGLRDFWREFIKVKTGLVGLVILLAFVALAVFGPSIVPFPGATDHWRDITFWQDNPQAAPPEWVNALPWVSKKGVVSSFLSNPKLSDEKQESGVVVRTCLFTYPFSSDEPPRDVVVRFEGEGQVPVDVTVTRPDGLSAELYREQLDIAAGVLQRVSVTNNCAQSIIEFVRAQNEDLASGLDADLIKPTSILFSRIDPSLANNPTMLKGAYTITVTALLLNDQSRFQNPTIVVSGHVSGLLGTDVSKRDIFTGIVIGSRWALIIGILTSLITVVLGVVLGVIAAYFGGVTDWLLSRLYELIYLLPVLPFLIVISAIFKPSIWTLIIIICLFFWTGPYKPVYSMALQIREETYIEASRALGSGRMRIIFRHIIPILLPYSFAVMALSVPAVIVYEASVSLLGLGDATIVTWGQVLHDALGQGAVISNLWWWVVPPGLTIALMGMSFAFLGTALDKILHPKLKTR
ncbi:MAG: ABC transporter permease [Spirochaetia bacterium]|jgi:peptide/nickel transport system permease protein